MFGLKTWLRSPADRDVISRWTPSAKRDEPLALRHAVLLPPPADPNQFQFLALGDSGNSDAAGSLLSPQDAVASEMALDSALPDTLDSGNRAQFILHMGDVIYMTGERRLYDRNFLRPYARFLTPDSTIGNLTFRLPFLPVPGNHDYYDLNRWLNMLVRIPLLGSGLRRLSFELFDFSLPRGGSGQGAAYMEAFVDTPKDPNTPTPYIPEKRTRLPNRYYRFQYGIADFFALDSNTLDAPPPWTGEAAREKEDASHRLPALKKRAEELEQMLRMEQASCDQAMTAREVEEAGTGLDPESCERRRRIAEEALDVQRAIAREEQRLRFGPEDYDAEQIRWLKASLDESERERPGAWRIVYLHHPLYSSIKNHCERSDVQDVRANLTELLQGRVHLILSGHSHAFEWFRSERLPHAGLFVTGGGGQVSLRPSILSPSRVAAHRDEYESLRSHGVAECAVAGKGPSAQDGAEGRLYHYLRIEVTNEVIHVRPVGVRRIKSGYRREEPMPVFHAGEMPSGAPSWDSRLLESVEIRRDTPPVARWS